jgi:hypothetical protein
MRDLHRRHPTPSSPRTPYAPPDSVVLIDTTQASLPDLGLLFDLRGYPSGVSHAELYDAALAACEWGERHFGNVMIR